MSNWDRWQQYYVAAITGAMAGELRDPDVIAKTAAHVATSALKEFERRRQVATEPPFLLALATNVRA